MKPKVGDTVVVTCARCGEQFAYTHARQRPRKFCTTECLRVYHEQRRRDRSMQKGDPVTCTCSVCGAEFAAIYAGRGPRPNRCSEACHRAAGRAAFRKWAAANPEKLREIRRRSYDRKKSELTQKKEVQSAEAAAE